MIDVEFLLACLLIVFILARLSFSYKLVKILYVYLSGC